MKDEWVRQKLTSWEAQEREKLRRYELNAKVLALANTLCDELTNTAESYVAEYNKHFQEYSSCLCIFRRMGKGFEISRQENLQKNLRVIPNSQSSVVIAYELNGNGKRASGSIEIVPDYVVEKPCFTIKEQKFETAEQLTEFLLDHFLRG